LPTPSLLNPFAEHLILNAFAALKQAPNMPERPATTGRKLKQFNNGIPLALPNASNGKRGHQQRNRHHGVTTILTVFAPVA
jgi:hypothetical protein